MKTTFGSYFDRLEGCRYGTFLVPKADQYVGEALRIYGEYSEIELSCYLPYAVGKRVVEVGANIGAHTVALAQHARYVTAVEPQPWVAMLCAANLVLNQCANARVVTAALSDWTGEVDILLTNPGQAQNFGAYELRLAAEAEFGTAVREKVPVLTIDDAAWADDLGFLKLDVEGMETAVLAGARHTLALYRPVVWFEGDREDNKASAVRLLKELGYTCYDVVTPLTNPGAWVPTTVDLFPNTVTYNVLALPPGESPPPYVGAPL